MSTAINFAATTGRLNKDTTPDKREREGDLTDGKEESEEEEEE